MAKKGSKAKNANEDDRQKARVTANDMYLHAVFWVPSHRVIIHAIDPLSSVLKGGETGCVGVQTLDPKPSYPNPEP